MADPLLIIRENRLGIDAWLVEEHKKSYMVQALARVDYQDLEPDVSDTVEPDTTSKDRSLFDAGLEAVVKSLDPAVKMDNTVSVILLLPCDRFYFRNISLPFTSRSKIRQVLPLELAARFPKEQQSVLTDFFQYELKGRQSKSMIFCGSIDSDTLESCHAGLTGAGFKPCAITPGSVAMAASYLWQNKDRQDFIFLDMDGCQMTLTLVARANIVQVRTLSGDASPRDVDRTIRQMLLGFWQRSGGAEPFDICVCTQLEQSDRKALSDALCDSLVFQTQFFDQTAGEPARPKTPVTPVFVDLSETLAAISLDLDMLNMCQGQFGSDSFLQTWKRYIISCCALALVAFILFMVNIHMDISRLEKQVEVKDQAMADIYKKTFPGKKLVGNIDPLQLMQSSAGELSRGGSANNGAENLSRVQAGNVLLELSSCIPTSVDIQVDRLMLDKDRMILSGSADNYNTIDQVKGFIEKSPFFKKVEIGSAVAGKRGNRVDFKFIIET